jgi:ubiquinone/menaquinone biosynthesis C-methylase UbiE
MADDDGRLRRLLEEYYRDTRGLPDWRRAVERRLQSGLYWQLKRLQAFVSLKDKRILDVGCGFGDLLVALEADRSASLVAGVDPDFEWLREARRRTDPQVVSVNIATGEQLPFPDNAFDGVCSNYAVEHVANLDTMLAEMMRVCAPGGWCYVNGPNHLVPYEKHYRMVLLLWLPKRWAEWWLERRGRNPSYLRCCIHFVTPFTVLRSLRRLGIASELNLMQQSIARPELFASEFVRRWARRISRLPWPSWLVYLVLPDFSMLVWKPANLPTETIS